MLRPVVLALTVLSGFTGLAYEVTWQKYLAILLGAHSEATAAVLGLFLGGLSLGYWLFGTVTRVLVERGRRSGRPAPLLLVYGAVEAGIGIYCLLFPALFSLVRSVSVWLPIGSGALAFAVDVALAATLVVPPATLMGATIPILTQALARNLADATRIHALIYASNTAGAFAGTLATGFFLIHWLGLAGMLHAMGLVNILVGAVFALLGYRRREVADLDSRDAAPLRGGVFAIYGSAALLVGFAMMVLQTTAIRIGGLSLGSSEYTFTMVVAVFVLCIALGSAAVSALRRIGRPLLAATLWGLGLLFTALYPALETGPYWSHVLRVIFRDLDAAFYPFYAASFAGIALVIGPAVVLSGATLPLLFQALRHEVGDLGSQAGRLYSANTVGSLLGALIGGYALLFWLDLHHVYRIALCALVLAASIVTLHQFPRIRFAGAGALLIAWFFAIDLLPPWRPSYLMTGTFRMRQPTEVTWSGPAAWGHEPPTYPFYDDDPNSSVAVQEFTPVGGTMTRSIVVNGKSDGNSETDYPTMAFAALVPALFSERAEHAFVIGFGLGVTAGELAQLQEMQSVTVAEISSGVIEAAPLFDFANLGVSKQPKVRIVRSDAYRALLRSERHYDVIVSEPSNPWVTGVEMLFSREFLEDARDHLTPGGVYCQWYHQYETSTEAIALVLRTYAAVFDHVAVWSVNRADLLLLGFQDAATALDLARLEQRFQRADFRAGFDRVEIRDVPSLLVLETLPLGVANAAALEGPIHSLYHPRLSFEAGRAFFVGQQGSLPFTGYGEAAEIGARNSLLRRQIGDANGAIPEPLQEQIVLRACESGIPACGALAAAWSRDRPNVKGLARISRHLQQEHGPLFLRRLRRFLAASPVGKSRIHPATALELTQLYMDNYAHAAPFDPGVLLEVWERCGTGPLGVALCKPGLRAAEGLVLGDAPPEAARWLKRLHEETTRRAARNPSPEAAPAEEDEEEVDADAEDS